MQKIDVPVELPKTIKLLIHLVDASISARFPYKKDLIVYYGSRTKKYYVLEYRCRKQEEYAYVTKNREEVVSYIKKYNTTLDVPFLQHLHSDQYMDYVSHVPTTLIYLDTMIPGKFETGTLLELYNHYKVMLLKEAFQKTNFYKYFCDNTGNLLEKYKEVPFIKPKGKLSDKFNKDIFVGEKSVNKIIKSYCIRAAKQHLKNVKGG